LKTRGSIKAVIRSDAFETETLVTGLSVNRRAVNLREWLHSNGSAAEV
jgi:hypothetical protein